MRIATRLPTTANPFRTPPIKYSGWYLCKTAVVGVTLFPIRLAVLATALALGGLCGALATIGTNPRSPRPPSPGRRLLVQPIRLFARAFLWALGYWHITVEYQPGSAPHRSRVLVVAPHYSLLDPIVMNWLELPCSVAKAAVAKMPVVGKVAVALQTIFVDRKDPDSKHKCVAAIKERATDAAWPPLLVFPEGTCTNGDVLISFKPGAFLPGVTVQPVVLRYPFEHLSVTGADASAEWRLLLSLFSVYNRLHVTYLPAVTPTAEEASDPVLFAARVRDEMAAALGVGVTAHSYEDVWLAAKAQKYGVDQTFEVQAVSRLLSITPDGVTQLLERFHALDSSGDGLLEQAEFVAALGLEAAPAGYATRLFSFFDADESGAISYVEFVQGLALMSPSTSAEEKVKLAFLLCDLDATGGVTLANLTRVLGLANPGLQPATAGSSGAADGGAPPASPAARGGGGGVPFLQRSDSARRAAFDKYDLDGDRVLDLHEFAAFVREHTDILEASGELVQQRLGQADLLSALSATVAKIKRERSQLAIERASEGGTPKERPPKETKAML